MQNDISLEEVKKDTAERQLQLQKMKKNIEALQINMAKKKLIGKNNNSINKPKLLDPQLRVDFQQTSKNPLNYQSEDRQLPYNSTLFKNINNESQPIMQNGSAVSNFSSVSNINNILNNNKPNIEQKAIYQSNSNEYSNDLLVNIDKVLEKVQKSQKMPVKTLQKIIESRQQKQNISVISNQSFNLSKVESYKKELSARTKLHQYKQMIKNLDQNFQQKQKIQPNFVKSQFKDNSFQYNSFDIVQNHYSKHFQKEYLEDIKVSSSIQHKKNVSSGSTFKSQYQFSQSIKLPPTPPSRHKVAENVVQRQKAKIKQSIQQYKKIQTQNSHQMLDKSQIDFELSDEQNSETQQQKQRRRKQLLKQKNQLLLQLKDIQEQLQKLGFENQFD